MTRRQHQPPCQAPCTSTIGESFGCAIEAAGKCDTAKVAAAPTSSWRRDNGEEANVFIVTIVCGNSWPGKCGILVLLTSMMSHDAGRRDSCDGRKYDGPWRWLWRLVSKVTSCAEPGRV